MDSGFEKPLLTKFIRYGCSWTGAEHGQPFFTLAAKTFLRCNLCQQQFCFVAQTKPLLSNHATEQLLFVWLAQLLYPCPYWSGKSCYNQVLWYRMKWWSSLTMSTKSTVTRTKALHVKKHPQVAAINWLWWHNWLSPPLPTTCTVSIWPHLCYLAHWVIRPIPWLVFHYHYM